MHPAYQESRPLQQRPRSVNRFLRGPMARLRCRHVALLVASLRTAASISYGTVFAFVKYEVCFAFEADLQSLP
jgi:hypothetical protein